jgi:two-component system CitB family response regulator
VAVIKVLVVDDDFRVAAMHAQFVRRVAGFEVVGVAHTAAEAAQLAAGRRPDLTLLDQYLPDGAGTDLAPHLSCDVIMLSAASEAAVVRAALGHGVVNYLVKPFTEADLADRLQAYARFRGQLGSRRPLTQVEIDRALRTLHEGDRIEGAVPKGRSAHTTNLVVEVLRSASRPLSATDVAARLGLSRATAQRYLSGLAAAGRVNVELRYGTTGRPEHLFRWQDFPARPRGHPR